MISGCSPTPEYRRRAEALRAAGLLRKPVSLETLLSAVARELGRPSQPSSARASAPAAAAPASDLSGTFDQLPFPALLHHLHGLRATGVLHLSHDRKRKWLRLHDGYPVGVRSNLVNECLGNFLVRAGRITASELAESRRRMKGGKLQGEMLVAMDLLSEDEVAIALRSQADEKLFEIFGWPTGAFRFEVGGNLQRANEIAVERSPANLILEGVRTRLPIERIDAHFAANSHCLLGLSDSPFYRFQEVDLDAAQQKLVRGLEKARRLVEFISADEAIRRTLYALIAAGMLELRGEVASAKPAAARAAVKPPSKTPRRPARVTTLREIVRPPQEDSKPAELTLLAQRFRGGSPFQILGVAENADEQAIQAAYGKLCELTHPDRVSQSSEAVKALASEVFAMVANAYETLIDPRRRQAYLLGQRKADRDAAERAVGRRALDAEIQFQEGDAAMRAKRLCHRAALLRARARALPRRGRVPRALRLGAAPLPSQRHGDGRRGDGARAARAQAGAGSGEALPVHGAPVQGDRPPRRGREDVRARAEDPAGLHRRAARAPPDQHAAREGKEPHRAPAPPVMAGGGGVDGSSGPGRADLA